METKHEITMPRELVRVELTPPRPLRIDERIYAQVRASIERTLKLRGEVANRRAAIASSEASLAKRTDELARLEGDAAGDAGVGELRALEARLEKDRTALRLAEKRAQASAEAAWNEARRATQLERTPIAEHDERCAQFVTRAREAIAHLERELRNVSGLSSGAQLNVVDRPLGVSSHLAGELTSKGIARPHLEPVAPAPVTPRAFLVTDRSPETAYWPDGRRPATPAAATTPAPAPAIVPAPARAPVPAHVAMPWLAPPPS